ncbi:MAG: DNA-3-methyladenine glycosylase [Candidatus Kapabacteria bacterium]|nr:DNA-3-methyladenine glycosylase [Candidatus Kapabacteria bacterium]
MIFTPDFSKSLNQSFFCRDTVTVARELLGKVLVKKEKNLFLASIITETEAYLSENDFASHSAVGKTERNKAMFEKGGIAYVYLIYGIHYCFNVVTEAENIGAAVLIRGSIPILGIDIMKNRRTNNNFKNLCKGPGNFGKAYGFDLSYNFRKIYEPSLFIQPIETEQNINNYINISPRKGITKSAHLPLRFFLENEMLLFQKYLPEV